MSVPLGHVAILIPARNEEELLPRCLRSVETARRALPAGMSSDVILVSDSSDDRTAELAKELLGTRGAVLTTEAGMVGCARALAARSALARFGGDPQQCWLANTDADCVIPGDWLQRQVAWAKRGYTALAGIVDVDCFDEHNSQVESLFRSTYRIHSDGTHPHVHGANLGVRGDAYLMAGGWGTLATAEDHDLWNRLRKGGARCRSDSALRVITSGRRAGRAPAGFAAALAAHNGAPA